MKLIVGLGNPGREYEATWHNLGFMLIDRLLEEGQSRRYRTEAEASVATSEIRGERILLVKPQTFMNLSGNAVRALLDRYGESEPSNLLVTVDDIALPLGMIRVRGDGSAGGHNGLKSIIERLGTHQFARLRMGIKPDHPVDEMADYVLSRISKRNRELVDEMVERAREAVEVIVVDGVERAMSLFNQRIKGAQLPETE